MPKKKKRSSEILADEKQKFFLEKVKLGKLSVESEKCFGNRGNLKQGEMHHCLRGDGRPCKSVKKWISEATATVEAKQ